MGPLGRNLEIPRKKKEKIRLFLYHVSCSSADSVPVEKNGCLGSFKRRLMGLLVGDTDNREGFENSILLPLLLLPLF
jgi:hypothetical protein